MVGHVAKHRRSNRAFHSAASGSNLKAFQGQYPEGGTEPVQAIPLVPSFIRAVSVSFADFLADERENPMMVRFSIFRTGIILESETASAVDCCVRAKLLARNLKIGVFLQLPEF